ncbi:ADP-ribose pyrophosphatase YjhB (NUDIX family) [Cryobacterium sp. CAN_C3]|uniref:NUDIX domain-containing protein n=1 Tax=unclassified Cryobacterium TaxID=2649013 RepID=UPI0018CA76C8|nr:NUDIX domain-containing protein [Cryobacterium sp. CAN_C3]MEC5156050.1 ADP-ribose pyrophosphatase YjhB (NUDIX family) [Cryobacterium sp. CAN_C3]
MRIDDFADRIRPVGVLYVDVHPFTWDSERGLEILLFKRNAEVPMPGQWQTVSGKLAKGERVVDGFLRQLKKKSGLHPSRLFKMSNVATFFDEFYDTVMLVPNALAFVEKTDIKLDGELHNSFMWATPDEALAHLAWPTQRQAVGAMQASMEWDGRSLSLRPNQFDVFELAI